MMERTLLLIKPDATRSKHIGEIITILEKSDFEVRQIKSFYFDKDLAAQFYAEHAGKEFYQPLVEFMTSGLVVGVLLEKENAIAELRELVGNTYPGKRHPGTIRYLYGDTARENAVHASDSPANSTREIGLIFPEQKAL